MDNLQTVCLKHVQTLEEAERALEEAKRLALAAFSASLDKVAIAGVRAGMARGDQLEKQLKGLAETTRTIIESIQDVPAPLAAHTRDTVGVGTVVADPAPARPKDVVLRIIARSPGLRGVDIARIALARAQPIPERTTRTALCRLRKEKLIKIVERRWYVFEAASDDPFSPPTNPACVALSSSS